MENRYELKLTGGKVVEWTGKSGEDAAQRYADTFKGTEMRAYKIISTGIYYYNGQEIVS